MRLASREHAERPLQRGPTGHAFNDHLIVSVA
jgi:hypothetical protein